MFTHAKKILILTVLVFSSACSSPKPEAVYTLDGKIFTLSDYQGKWVFINYWAPWCGVCRAEIPELNAFYRKHHKEAVVLGVNYDFPTHEQLASVVKQLSIHYPIIESDPSSLLGVKDVPGVPVTFVIDPEGHQHELLLGRQTKQQLEALLASLEGEYE